MKDIISSLTLIIPLATEAHALLILPSNYHKGTVCTLGHRDDLETIAGTERGNKNQSLKNSLDVTSQDFRSYI